MHLKGGFAGPFFWLAGLPGDTLKSKWQTGILRNYSGASFKHDLRSGRKIQEFTRRFYENEYDKAAV